MLDINFLEDGATLMAPPSSSPRRHRPLITVPVERSGCADALAVWFDLWLDDEREERDVVSTRPEQHTEGDASGWVRVVYDHAGTNKPYAPSWRPRVRYLVFNLGPPGHQSPCVLLERALGCRTCILHGGTHSLSRYSAVIVQVPEVRNRW